MFFKRAHSVATLSALVLGILLAVCTNAQDFASASIAIYSQQKCRGSYVLCSNATAKTCCHVTNKTFSSAKFINIPTNAIAATFQKNGTTTCKTATNAIEGPGCVTGKNGPQNGAAFFGGVSSKGSKLASRKRVVDDFNCITRVIADIVVIDGHYFKMGESIPAEDAAKFFTLVQQDASFTDVPGHLKKYKI